MALTELFGWLWLVLAFAGVLGAGQSATDAGIAAFNQGRYSVALAKLQGTKDPAGLVFLALTQAALGDCKTALPTLNKTGESGEATLNALAGIGAVKCYASAGNEGAAFTLLDSLERRFPKNADVLYTVAKLHMKAFNNATYAMFQRTPSSYRVHELSAEIFEVQNRYGEAVAEYRKAIEMNPSAPDLHYRLGRALLLQKHDPETLKQAAAEFRAELKLSPEDSACEFQLGQIAAVEANDSEAKARFERAVSLSPHFVQALIALGRLSTKEKNYSRAIELLSWAAEVEPANESVHYALMTAYRDAGEMEKAKSEKTILDRLQKPPEGEFSDFLKRLGEKQPQQ